MARPWYNQRTAATSLILNTHENHPPHISFSIQKQRCQVVKCTPLILLIYRLAAMHLSPLRSTPTHSLAPISPNGYRSI